MWIKIRGDQGLAARARQDPSWRSRREEHEYTAAVLLIGTPIAPTSPTRLFPLSGRTIRATTVDPDPI